MSNIFEELGKKVVGEIAHVATEAVVDVVKKGAEELNDALRGKEPAPLPPALQEKEEK